MERAESLDELEKEVRLVAVVDGGLESRYVAYNGGGGREHDDLVGLGGEEVRLGDIFGREEFFERFQKGLWWQDPEQTSWSNTSLLST